LRILIVTARYAPHVGGLETVVREVAAQLRQEGHTISLVTNRFPRTLPKYEEIENIPVRRLFFLVPKLSYLRSGHLVEWLAGLAFLPLTLIQLLRILLTYRPDVVNLHYLGSPAFFLLVLHYLLHFRLVVSLHGGDVDGEPYQSRFNRWLFEALLDRATKVTACSQVLLDHALGLAPRILPKSSVIHNGVNTQLFESAKIYDHTRPYLFAVGQLSQHKGFDTLITAFAHISKDVQELDLLIAGDGPERRRLSEQVLSYDLSQRVHLLGSISREEVASLMRGCFAVVIPSRREPFGIVGLEAMASGRPIIATRIGGLTEALADADVRWISIDNQLSDLTIALLTLMDTYGLQEDVISVDNQEKSRRYSWQRVASHYLEVFLEATEARYIRDN